MKSRQTGFTLIELVMVIVLIGVLAAVAVPKFIDLGSDARAAALSGVAGGMTSSGAVNYAARKANAANGTAVDNCNDIGATMQGGAPTGYTVTAGAIVAEVTTNCTLTQDNGGATTTFALTGIN